MGGCQLLPVQSRASFGIGESVVAVMPIPCASAENFYWVGT